MKTRIIASYWLLALGCSAGAIPETTEEGPLGSSEEELTATADRVITVDFYQLHGPNSHIVSRAEVDAGIAFANRIWQRANIEWRVGTLKTVNTTYLHDFYNNPTVAWSAIKNDAAALGIRDATFPNSTKGNMFEWSAVLATYLPVSHVPVFLTSDDNHPSSCGSQMPHNDGDTDGITWPGVTDTSHLIQCGHMPTDNEDGEHYDLKALAHELGHFVGLAHTSADADNIRATGSEPYEYYDLVFEPTSTGPKVFFSAAAARQAASLVSKDNGTCGQLACVDPDDGSLQCNTTCNWNGRLYDSSSIELTGLTFGTWGTADYGLNVMSYHCSFCRLELSGSQMDVAKKFLMGAKGQRYLLGGPVANRGDFESDGLGDIALTGVASWTYVPIAKSKKDGTFNISGVFGTGNFNDFSSQSGARTVSGDFDGDGRLDLAATGVSWWTTNPVAFSKGGGVFNVKNLSSANFNAYSSQAGARVVSGDFNGDGRTDLLAVGGTGWNTVPVAYSKGNGEFTITNQTMPTDFNVFARTSNVRVLVGDFDGNGTSDLVATGNSSWNTLPVAFSNSDGTWRVTNLSGDFNAYTSQAGVKVLAGDFNGDGKSDLVATGGPGWSTTPITFSRGDGTFSTSNRSDTGGNFNVFSAQAGVQVVALDYDGDGRTDLVAAGGPGWTSTPIAWRKSSNAFDITNVSSGLNTYIQQGAKALSL